MAFIMPGNRIASSQDRIHSIDVFRGLTIFTMVFVNDVGKLQGIPWWMRHAPDGKNYMTFVDLVFPAFLFIVGMSIPFALSRRLAGGQSPVRVAAHILTRTVSLLIIGLFMVNMSRFDANAAGISKSLWVVLVYVCVVLTWNLYPRRPGVSGWLCVALRVLGMVGLVSLAAVYRGYEANGTTWMQTSWWGILGLIGWAYLVTSITYSVFRRQPAALVGVLAVLITMWIGDKTGAFGVLGDRLRVPGLIAHIRDYVDLGVHIGGHSAIATAGVIVGMLFLGASPAATPRRRLAWIIVFAGGLFVVGFLLRPLYGISKNGATPTWCLYSAGLSCLIYVVLYWLVDLKGAKTWAFFLKPAGANPLLAFILPDTVYSLLAVAGITYHRTHWNVGATGVVRSLVFALAIVVLTSLLGRLRVRLHL
jgi:heparan-alpha-glucosaminide N-acetyltransferase